MQEARLLKKLRAKKITEAEFEARMASLQSGANIPSEGCDLPIMIIILQSDGVNLTIYSSTLARVHVTTIAPPPAHTPFSVFSLLACACFLSSCSLIFGLWSARERARDVVHRRQQGVARAADGHKKSLRQRRTTKKRRTAAAVRAASKHD
eukprot:COSAG01_NODE_27_length_36706_cov_155.674106_16_plen_151_part_00